MNGHTPRGAQTPEELTLLFEDACIIQNVDGVVQLFEPDALLVDAARPVEARGETQIVDAASAMWARQRRLLAAPHRLLQAGDTALSLGAVVTVMRRGPDRAWRYAICAMTERERP